MEAEGARGSARVRGRAARLSLVLLAIAATSAGGQDSSLAKLLFKTALKATAPKPTIVLVHGAFTDAAEWQYVIPILRKDGYKVIAVENTQSSLADDIAATKAVIRAQKGPLIVVGHSYGGAVITGAAAGSLNVRALVYLAAFAPDAGESVGAFNEKYPSALGAAVRRDADGYAYIDRAQFRDVFARDVSEDKARAMAEREKKVSPAVLDQPMGFPAWRTIRSWYLVSKDDRAINPNLERFFAKRMGAATSEVRASHMALISQPKIVARFIEEAAEAARR